MPPTARHSVKRSLLDCWYPYETVGVILAALGSAAEQFLFGVTFSVASDEPSVCQSRTQSLLPTISERQRPSGKVGRSERKRRERGGGMRQLHYNNTEGAEREASGWCARKPNKGWQRSEWQSSHAYEHDCARFGRARIGRRRRQQCTREAISSGEEKHPDSVNFQHVNLAFDPEFHRVEPVLQCPAKYPQTYAHLPDNPPSCLTYTVLAASTILFTDPLRRETSTRDLQWASPLW